MPLLRIGTHNVRGGLTDAVHVFALTKLWLRERLDIVCLQETHLGVASQALAERCLSVACEQLGGGGWVAFWSHCTAGAAGSDAASGGAVGVDTSMGADRSDTSADSHHRSYAGVGILVRASLLSSGIVNWHVSATAEAAVTRSASGRLITMSICWGGHSFSLSCVYLPSGDAPGQRSFISHYLAPLAQRPGHQLWAGDFNFAMAGYLDRASLSQRDAGTAAAWQSTCSDLVDAFRAKHPYRRTFTFFGNNAASRIDRFHVSEGMMSHVAACAIPDGSMSDHRLVTLHLSPIAPPAVGRGLRRVRLSFWEHADLQQSLMQWLMPAAAAAPLLDDDALLWWWPGFKMRLAVVAHSLSRQAGARQRLLKASAAAALQDLHAAHEAMERPGPCDSRIAAAVEARARFAAAMRVEGNAAALQYRHTWLHCRERPCPLLTTLTRPPQHVRHVAALRDDAGGLCQRSDSLSQLVADFWAAISAPKPTNIAAREAVLGAMRAEASLHILQQDADILGAADISVDAIAAALRSVPSGHSPGPDGIPVELYRRCGDVLRPLLAAVFSAIGRSHRTPPGFLDGAIKTLPKTGDLQLRSNYRPITLLNTDYRLLTKILALRLGPILHKHIAPEQTAFLPSRHIGENILLLQLLPQLLRQQGHTAVITFLDFAKAYDTLDRPFLMAAMDTMGVGDGFSSWVNTLLCRTHAVAVVNGFISRPVFFGAGVRQGCPLSPLLYLFVAQALNSWLKQCGIGVELTPSPVCGGENNRNIGVVAAASGSGSGNSAHSRGCLSGGVSSGHPFAASLTTCPPSCLHSGGSVRLTLAQYADDTQVLLPSLSVERCLRPFLDHMQLFASASGQHLNVGKSELLPIGDLTGGNSSGDGNADVFCGMRVVERASALGITFDNDAGCDMGAASWEQRVVAVENTYSKLAKLPLSIFGRGFASAAYGISQFLYHAEHGGLPPAAMLRRLRLVTAKLVDRGRAPGCSNASPLPGVRADLLSGRPCEGGFGALPWEQHILARHAVWGARAVASATDDRPSASRPMWTVVLGLLLSSLHPAATPLHLLTVDTTTWRLPLPSWSASTTRAAVIPPGAVRRLCCGLVALRPLVVANAAAVQPGAWCFNAPLWGNPLLPPAFEAAVRDFMAKSWGVPLYTVADLLFYSTWQNPRSSIPHVVREQRWRGDLAAGEILLRMDCARLLRALPIGWHDAALAVLHCSDGFPPVSHGVTAAATAILPSLGWRRMMSNGEATFVPLVGLSVGIATQLQLGPVYELRASRHAAFLSEALLLPTGGFPPAGELARFRLTLRQAWRLPVENCRKEPFWRLALDGLPGHQLAARPCPCGAPSCSRPHIFWDCPVARAVTNALQEELAAAPNLSGVAPPPSDAAHVGLLQRTNVWLAHPPQHVNHFVWLIVCLAAVSAMDLGHRWMAALRRRQEDVAVSVASVGAPTPSPQLVQSTLSQLWGHVGPSPAGGPGPPVSQPTSPQPHRQRQQQQHQRGQWLLFGSVLVTWLHWV